MRGRVYANCRKQLHGRSARLTRRQGCLRFCRKVEQGELFHDYKSAGVAVAERGAEAAGPYRCPPIS